MTESQNGTTTDAQNETTDAAVLDEIESELADSDKVELSDDQMQAIGAWADDHHTPSRRPEISTSRDADPVSYKLYDISDVDGYSTGDWLALEVHDKQQGERYTRPYATGIGPINIESASDVSVEELRSRFETEVETWNDEHTPETPADEQFELVVEFVERSDEMVAENALYEDSGTWAAAYDGSKLHTEPTYSRWEGFESMMQPDLSENQLKALKEIGIETHSLRHLNTTSAFSFVAKVTFGEQ